MSKRLELIHISKAFGPVKALENVSFDLDIGEVHAICGENGAGKSTLMNILSGNVSQDTGEVLIEGAEVELKSQFHANQLGIAIVYQHLSLFANRTVAENIFVNHFPEKGFGIIDYAKLFTETQSLLEKLKMEHILRPETMVSELSAAQRQMVEIAKALARKPQVLILDEPTASISGNDVQTLFGIISDLRSGETSIVYISHRMEEIFEISDRVTVLKDGKRVGVWNTAELTRSKLIAMMVGREISRPQIAGHKIPEEVMLEVSGLSNDRIHDISFKIHRGEVVALAGLAGAGRTEIAMTIFGAMPRTRGRILVRNTEVDIRSPADAIAQKIAFVPEDRKSLGLFSSMTICENINSVDPGSKKKRKVNQNKQVAVAEKFKNQMRIVSSSVHQLVSGLSGGNQQKVVLSKWLSNNPEILIIDEPTHGIDIGAKFEIYDLLRRLAAEGVAILLISSELPEVLAISNRILVVKSGIINQELVTADTNEEQIMHWAM